MVDTEANNAIELHNTLIDGGRRAFYRPVLLPLFMNGVEVKFSEVGGSKLGLSVGAWGLGPGESALSAGPNASASHTRYPDL
jgi:hypothetical protein